jgi:hypothetical protein
VELAKNLKERGHLLDLSMDKIKTSFKETEWNGEH